MQTFKFFCIIFISFFLLNSNIVEAQNKKPQTGTITGVLKDKKTKETVVGANVVIQGTLIGASTDLNGQFVLPNIGEGTHNLVVSLISYKTEVIPDVRVKRGENTIVNVDIEETSTQLDAVEIKANKKTDTEISMINTIKKSELIVSGISNQQITKTQDKSASDVIKRVPGITIVNDKFVMVRGLSERYNSVWLNNSPAPSFEADIRAFSFDVVPSNLIENLLIYKTPAPELPSDFAGGVIALNTRNTSDKNAITISYGTGYSEGTTFKDFYSYKAGNTDWLGYDDGTRQLPDGFPENLSKNSVNSRIVYSQILNKIWEPEKTKAGLDQKFGITGLKKFTINKMSIGNITALNYSNTNNSKHVFRTAFQSYNIEEDHPDTNYYFTDDVYQNNVKVSLLHNWSLVWGNNQKIEFRNLLVQLANNKTLLRDGYTYYGGQYIKGHSMLFESRSIYTGQLGGFNSFNNENSKINWTLAYSHTNKNVPDSKMVTKVRNDNEGEHFKDYYLNVSFAPTPQFCGRIFQNLNEDIISANLQFEQNLAINDFTPTLKSGVYFEKKNRVFTIRNIGYVQANPAIYNQELGYKPLSEIFQDENINNTSGLMLQETTANSDSYDAENNIIAGFVALNIPIGSLVNIYCGARLEKNIQTLNSFMVDRQDIPVHVKIDSVYMLPSINTTFSLTEKSLLRLAYGPTINRPEFREVAPLAFYDFEEMASYRGNPSLKNAVIQNFDFRYEWYPSVSETFSLALFYKQFKNPIEVIAISTGSGVEYTYHNADKANNYGAEIDVRKSFNNLKNSFLKDFMVVLNASYIKSEVEINNVSYLSENKRAMQGQSPFIINTGIYYQHDKTNIMISGVYNVIGKRIKVVGDPDHPTIYEMPHHQIDLTIAKGLFNQKLNIKAGVIDLLNQKMIQKQYLDLPIGTREQTTLEYFPGRNYNFSISYNF